MALTLTAREHEMLAAVLKEMDDLPSVDFTKVADRTGHKYSRNARSAFKKVWEKLKSANGNAPDGAESGADGESVTPVKPKAKSIRKKGVGKKVGPRKAGADGPKTNKRKTKKERDDEKAAMAVALADAEEEDIANADCDDASVAGSDSENGDDANSVKEEEEQKEGEGGEFQKIEEDDEELGSRLMGIPLEDFRRMAKETRWFTAAQTPEPTGCSDDEVV